MVIVSDPFVETARLAIKQRPEKVDPSSKRERGRVANTADLSVLVRRIDREGRV